MYKILTLALLVSFSSMAQTTQTYWVFLTDKGTESFDPLAFFDARAVERRVLQGIAFKENDQPVDNQYKSQVNQLSQAYVGESRWFNAIAVDATQEQVQRLKQLPYVRSVKEVTPWQGTLTSSSTMNSMSGAQRILAERQLRVMGGDIFDSLNITGKGVRVAVFDGGFPEVDTHPAFERMRKENRIKATYNFPKEDEFVYKFNSHGLATLSNVAGEVDGFKLGLATDVEVILARSEIGREIRKEEVYWIMALEWADKNGAQIINSSLGYTMPRYNQLDMDGKTSMISRAANTAASKGILVVNSAGNEGTDNWETIGAPADADSVLAVGGVDPVTDAHMGFGSYGPSADGRMKPNVSNYAHATVASKGHGFDQAFGTSFSSPLTAGFAACALQMNPGVKVMDLFEQIEQSGHLYPYYDYAMGYGIPQASYFVDQIGVSSKNYTASFSDNVLEIEVSNVHNIHPKAGQHLTNTQLYFHIADANGKLLKYWVRDVRSGEARRYNLSDFAGQIAEIRIYLNGHYEVLKP